MADTLKRYAFYMSLIKQRYYHTLPAVQGGFGSIYEAESAALNIRKMCEAIAYACAAILNHNKKTAKLHSLLKDYAADKIITEVLKADGECFPQPIHIEFNPETRFHKYQKVEDRTPTPKEFKDLYRKCHDYLHEQKVEAIAADRAKAESEMAHGLALIRSLASVHMIKCQNAHFVVVLGEDDNKPPLTFSAGS